MQITWKITKNRGYVRPMLTYQIEFEEHEKALCLPSMRVRSCITEPIDSWQEHCWPGQHERADPPRFGKMYDIDIPSHQGRCGEFSLRLPWREDNQYPEVETTFNEVRAAYEEELKKAYQSQPMHVEQKLKPTQAVKQYLAPGVLAERLLAATRTMSKVS